MAGHETPDGDGNVPPPPDEEGDPAPPPPDPWSFPPPPPAGWGLGSAGPALPWAAPPGYDAGAWAPLPATPSPPVDAGPEPAAPAEGAPDTGDPWRIPPQPPWNPATDPPPTGQVPAYLPLSERHRPAPAELDLPPSATGPRSTPQQPMEARPAPRPAGAPPAVFDEPWRREGPGRGSGDGRLRPIVIGGAVLAVAGLVAAGVVAWPGGGKHKATTGPAAELAGRTFAADPAATADGRDQTLTGVASAGSTVVAIGGEDDGVGQRPQFLVSSDGGRSFRLAAVRTLDGDEPPYDDMPRQIAAANGAWVALGDHADGTAVWTSRDGKAWIRQPDAAGSAFGRTDQIARVSGTGSGFIAVGSTTPQGGFPTPVVWRSADGRRWDRVTGGRLRLPADAKRLSLVGVAASRGTVIVHGVGTSGGKRPRPIDGIWRSADGGATWEPAAVPAPGGPAGFGIAATSSGLLVAREARDRSGRYAAVFGSADARTWTSVGDIRLPGYSRLLRLAGSGQGVAAIAATGRTATLLHSSDGGSWQSAGAVPLPAGRTLTDVSQAAGQTVLVGRDRAASDNDAVLIVRDGQGQDVPVSRASIPGAVQPDKTVNAVGAANGRIVAVGGTNGTPASWTSADGRTWQRGQAAPRDARQRLRSVTAGNAGLLAVGVTAPRHPLVLTSANGASWQPADGAAPFRAGTGASLVTYAAAMGPAGYVIVGEDGLSAATWFSPDLKSWQRGAAPVRKDLAGSGSAGRWMRDVAGGSFGYVAVGGLNDPAARTGRPGRPAVWTSSDGRAWALRQLPLPGGAVGAWFDHVAAKGALLVATGTATGSSGTRAFAFVSADGGRAWQETALPQGGTEDQTVTAMTATARGFVVAGTVGRPGSADVVLWTSADGRTWNLDRPTGTGLSGRGEQRLTGLVATGSDLLGVGLTADHTGEQPTLWRRALP